MTKIKQGVFWEDLANDMKKDQLYFKLLLPQRKTIKEIYSSLPGSRFNGGRANGHMQKGKDLHGKSIDGKILEKVGNTMDITRDFLDSIKGLNSAGFSFHLVANNNQITKEHLDDEQFIFALDYLSKLSKKKKMDNGVIFTSDSVADFVRKNYPNLKLTVSVIKFYSEPSLTYNGMLEKYDKIVIMDNDVLDIKKLKEIPYAKRKDAYIIISQSGCRNECTCPIAKRHYELTGRYNLGENVSFPGCLLRDQDETTTRGKTVFNTWLNSLIDIGFTSGKISREDWSASIKKQFDPSYKIVDLVNGGM